MTKIRIVADSSANLTEITGMDFASAPLKITTAVKEYVDNESLDAEAMATDLLSYKGKSTTSCPNTEDWLRAFGDAEQIFCMTITAALSGSYNSAMLAKRRYEESHPDRKVFVLNTLSTGPEMGLIAEKLCELAKSGADFDSICRDIEDYSQKTGLLFVLESLKNLANNGRVNSIVAKMAGILGIRIVGKASDKGELEPLDKPRGAKMTRMKVVERLSSLGYVGGRLHITHALNPTEAENLKADVLVKFPTAEISIDKCGGLCSFYAEKGGLLIGFEKG